MGTAGLGSSVTYVGVAATHPTIRLGHGSNILGLA